MDTFNYPTKAFTPVRMEPKMREKLDRLASKETEGNRSQMIRKLITEALEAREVGNAGG